MADFGESAQESTRARKSSRLHEPFANDRFLPPDSPFHQSWSRGNYTLASIAAQESHRSAFSRGIDGRTFLSHEQVSDVNETTSDGTGRLSLLLSGEDSGPSLLWESLAGKMVRKNVMT